MFTRNECAPGDEGLGEENKLFWTRVVRESSNTAAQLPILQQDN